MGAGPSKGDTGLTHMQLDGEPWPQAIPAAKGAVPITVSAFFLFMMCARYLARYAVHDQARCTFYLHAMPLECYLASHG